MHKINIEYTTKFAKSESNDQNVVLVPTCWSCYVFYVIFDILIRQLLVFALKWMIVFK